MAVVSSELSSIAIASAATHPSLLELHCKPPPSVAGTVSRSPTCESQADEDERLVRTLPEQNPLDGQSQVETGDLPSVPGSTLDRPHHEIPIDEACLISEETPFTSEISSPTVLPETNDRHSQIENNSGLPVPMDTVHCTTTTAQCFRGISECSPSLTSEPTLRDRAPSGLKVEDRLAHMRRKVFEDRSDRIYVPLRANPNPRVSNKTLLPLMPTVMEFLESKLRVFLLLGDSGSGKSTFCRQLVRTLWSNYTQGSRIPIFVDLRDIDRPSDDLIESHLQEHGFSDIDVRELIHERKFVLVCDGYDESRLSTSIYTKRLGQLDVKMVVSCRNAFLGRHYQGRFYPLGDDKYHDKCSELFEEAMIAPFQESDIQNFIKQHITNFYTQEPPDTPPTQRYQDYWEKISAIPNLKDLISNPFLLTLTLRALPSLSNDLQDLANNKALRLKLYDGFVKEWIRINITRLQRSKLSQECRCVFDSLLNDGFAWCVKDFSKRLAEAMHEHQRGQLVVNFSRWHSEPWKVEFFGEEIESTLLRESSLLSRAGFRHWFIHRSLFDYFRSLVLYDPDESDNDDPDEDWGDPHGGSGNPFNNEGDGHFDGDGDFHGGYGSLSGRNVVSTRNSGGSTGDGSGGPADSSSDSTGAGSDSAGGNGDSNGSNGGSADSNGGLPGGHSSSTGGNDGSGGKDGPSGNSDNSHQGKNSYRSRRKARNTSLPSSDPLSTQNLLEDPEVLEFLVERAQSDSRFKKRLLLTIEQSKSSSVPPLAAANAIVILIKSGETLGDAILEGVMVPTGYLLPGSVQEHTAGTGTTGRILIMTLSALQGSLRRVAPLILKRYRPSHLESLLPEGHPLSPPSPAGNADQIDSQKMRRISDLNRTHNFINMRAENQHSDLPSTQSVKMCGRA